MANHKNNHNLTLGQRLADRIAVVAGSWPFIVGLLVILFVWMAINTYFVVIGAWDPYPFILLNLFLSTLAAFQAPVILMSQNRVTERDRSKAERDYYINRKAEREIKIIKLELIDLKHNLLKQPRSKELAGLESEIQGLHSEIQKMENALGQNK